MSTNHIPAPTTFTYRGKTVVLTPLKLKDFAELEIRLKQIPYEAIKPVLEGMKEGAGKHLLDQAHADAKAIRIGSDAFEQATQTYQGLAYMLFLAVRKEHKDFTYEMVEEMLDENFAELAAKVNQMAGRIEPDPLAKTPPAGETKPPETTP